MAEPTSDDERHLLNLSDQLVLLGFFLKFIFLQGYTNNEQC